MNSALEGGQLGSLTARVPSGFEEAFEDLSRQGACIITEALDRSLLVELRQALYRIADGDRRRGWVPKMDYAGEDAINQRIYGLPSRDAVFCDLAEHPLALRFIERVLGWPAMLSSMSANIVNPGGGSMVLHADQGYMPRPWARSMVLNFAWCIDDFTADNGATRFVPGSQALNADPRESSTAPASVPLEAPAGSVLILDGRVWHTNGRNNSASGRAGIFATYSLPVIMPQENWALSINPIVRQFGSETLLTLLGFRPQLLGRVNGFERI